MGKNTNARHNVVGRLSDCPITIVPDRDGPTYKGEVRFRVNGNEITVHFEDGHWAILRCLAQGARGVGTIRQLTRLRLMTIMNYICHIRSHLPLVGGEETLLREGRGDSLRYVLRGVRLQR